MQQYNNMDDLVFWETLKSFHSHTSRNMAFENKFLIAVDGKFCRGVRKFLHSPNL